MITPDPDRWQQMAPSLASVCSSNIPLKAGTTRWITECSPNSPTKGSRARVCILGPATREDYIREFGPDLTSSQKYFYWVSFD